MLAVTLFGVVYLVVGVAFPNPPAANKLQFRNSPRRTGLHASMSVALGAFGLAAAANIHALTSGTGNQRLLALALVIWPIMTSVPAFVVALAAAAVFARLRPND